MDTPEELMISSSCPGPERRPFLPGGKDPRDKALEERVLSSKVAWEGAIFDVEVEEVSLPNGHKGRRDIIRHPGAVAIVALTEDNCILLVRQYRAPLGRVTVEIPAGKLEPGEDPLVCAERELVEETGCVAREMAYLTTIASTVGFSDELLHIYLATGITFTDPEPDEDEFLAIDLVDLDEFIDAVLDGQVEDAKTVVGALAMDVIRRRLEISEP